MDGDHGPHHDWIPVCTGMTEGKTGMTGEKTGMTGEKTGMTGEKKACR
jgi:hypothetical protein